MDELFHELNLYLDPSVVASMGNSAEQNTAALIASSMNSEYEEDWSTPPNSYRDSHTPLTNSSISSNSTEHKLGFGENSISRQWVHNGSIVSAIEVNEESLPLLTFNECEEIRNYTDLDLLETAAPSVLSEMNGSCHQPESIGAPINQELKSNNITPTKSKPKKMLHPTKKKKKQVLGITCQLECPATQSTMEVNEDGGFLGFNEESVRVSRFVKKSLPQMMPSKSEISSSPVKRALSLEPKKDTPTVSDSKLTTKAPSYLTLFPMRCKEYPMIYSCNHCVGIFTSIRAGQLHDCVKKRRGRKAGTKLKQSYSNNFSDWSQM